MYPNQDYTIHTQFHSPKNPEYFCEHCERYQQANDNLFSASHRTNMLAKYGYTSALFVTVEDLTK
jgi:hypothetical protein